LQILSGKKRRRRPNIYLGSIMVNGNDWTYELAINDI
jgi:hypothetical protein